MLAWRAALPVVSELLQRDMDPSNASSPDFDPIPTDSHEEIDPSLERDIHRLHQLTVYARWAVVAVLWLTLGAWSLWGFRDDIRLMMDYFTWAAARYALAFNRVGAVGLGLCLGMTTATLLVQSRAILWGIPSNERQRLKQQALKIRQQGQSHPLWQWMRLSSQ